MSGRFRINDLHEQVNELQGLRGEAKADFAAYGWDFARFAIVSLGDRIAETDAEIDRLERIEAMR